MITSWQERSKDLGLFIMRVGLGLMFMGHGFPKLAGGMAAWEQLGQAMSIFGFDAYPHVWGLFAAIAEFGGGLMLILGFVFRPFCVLLVGTMVVAATKHIHNGDGLGAASHAIEAAVVFAGFIFTGPGRYTVAYFDRDRI